VQEGGGFVILGWLRLLLMAAVVLTAVYWIVVVYARSVRRETLEKRWDAGEGSGEREHFIEAGMADYEKGLKRRLLWLVYILPGIVFAILIYVVNYQ
jgi:Ca2+/Na+ antiporter